MSSDQLVARAESHPDRYRGGSLPARPARQVAIVCCMDARIDVWSLFGLEPGEAHVIRNAGGIVTDDVIRSLAISQRALGTTEVLLVHHSSCGMQGLDDDEFARTLEAETGSRPPWAAGGFTDAADDVRQGASRLAECAWLPSRHSIRGFVLDVKTGGLEEIDLR